MSVSIDSKELTAYGRTDIEDEMHELVDHVLMERPINTMDRKLIIEASTPGHYPRLLWEQFGVRDMPPWSVEELSNSIIDCVKAGAAGIHSHPRDPYGPFCYECNIARDMAPELTKELFDKVYQEVDFVPLNHAWYPKNWEDLADADFQVHLVERASTLGGRMAQIDKTFPSMDCAI